MAEREDELDAAAADYVLGTLDAAERRAFLQRLAREPAAAIAVRDWQERLAPLALGLAPMPPPDGLFGRIEAALGETTPAWAAGAANDNRVARWRAAAIAASVAALVASGLALRGPHLAPLPVPAAPREVAAFAPGASVAALSAEGRTPGLFVTYDKASGRLRVVPVGLSADAAHSFELWLIQGKQAPRAMGLIDVRSGAERKTVIDTAAATTFAVSREPVGGSPTGQPTGPVIYSGALVDLPRS